MKQNDRNKLYIQKILEYCERIEAAVSRFGDSYDAFTNDADYKDVVCMNVFPIGELANQLSDDIKEKYNDVPWNQMYGIRNRLAHAYIEIDDSIVWDTVKNDIPRLKEKIKSHFDVC